MWFSTTHIIRESGTLLFWLRLCCVVSSAVQRAFLLLVFASSQELEAGSFLLLQHCLHNLDLSPLSIVGIGGEVKQLGILSRACGVEQVLHHGQSAIVVLNHSCQKQMVELGILRLPQRLHLFRCKHT